MNNRSWLEAFGHELQAAGVSVEDRAAALVETEGFLSEAQLLAFEHFGPPVLYANAIVSALGGVGRRCSNRPSNSPVAVVVELSKSYRKRVVLDAISLTVNEGEVVVLVGPNGAGKSTLLRLVAGLEHPDSGSVSVSGRVGYVPQDGGLDPYLKPCEHFALFGAPNGLGRQAAIREGSRLALELGWDVLSAPVVGQLSGGTRQKLSVITALLGSPRLLLLDEPYQGMDADSSRRFWDLLWAWQEEGGAALVSSHSPDALSKASTVVELEGTSAR